jgi:transposase
MKDYRIKSSSNQIAKSLEGDYRQEHLFVLGQSLELYEFYHKKIDECDEKIIAHMQKFQPKVDIKEKPLKERKGSHKKPQRNEPKEDWRPYLYQMSGVDLTQINGINTLTAQIITAEIGLDMSKWSTEKHFTSWLGLCPDTRRSGGKQLKGKGKKRKVVNRAAQALRMAAQSLKESKSALGAYLRRMKSRLGMAMAIKATAHKLARLVYRMLKYGEEYVDQGERYYEEKYRQRTIKNLKKRAETLGFELMEKQPTAQALQ